MKFDYTIEQLNRIKEELYERLDLYKNDSGFVNWMSENEPNFNLQEAKERLDKNIINLQQAIKILKESEEK